MSAFGRRNGMGSGPGARPSFGTAAPMKGPAPARPAEGGSQFLLGQSFFQTSLLYQHSQFKFLISFFQFFSFRSSSFSILLIDELIKVF